MDKHAAGYIRVSSEEQAAHGISVDAQRAILEAWATMTGAGHIAIYEDAGYSGKNTNRPALQRLLADVRRGEISAVVVWKLDRLSRSLRDTLTIIEDVFQPAGIALVSTTESIDTATPSGRMMLNMLASFAQLEREQDSDRVLMAHRHLAEDCRYLGGHIPIGYRVDESRHYALDPATAPIVRRVFEMYLARDGYTPILDYLNSAASQFFKRKTPWKKVDLNYLLGNEFYAGVYLRKIGKEAIRVPGGVPAIITLGEWEQVCRQRRENTTAAGSYRRGVWPLSGLIRCGVCGRNMVLENVGKDRNGTVARYYACRSGCVKPVRLEKLESAVLAICDEMAGHEDEVIRACNTANTFAAIHDEDALADAALLERELQQIHRRQAQIVAFVSNSGADAPRALMAEMKHLEAQEADLVLRLEALRRPSSRYNPADTLSALTALRGAQKKPPEERRALLRGAFSAIIVRPEELDVAFLWHACRGDDPPLYACHKIPRAANGQLLPWRPPFATTTAYNQA